MIIDLLHPPPRVESKKAFVERLLAAESHLPHRYSAKYRIAETDLSAPLPQADMLSTSVVQPNPSNPMMEPFISGSSRSYAMGCVQFASM